MFASVGVRCWYGGSESLDQDQWWWLSLCVAAQWSWHTHASQHLKQAQATTQYTTVQSNYISYYFYDSSLPVRSLAKSKYNSDQFSPDYWNCECGVVQISSSEWNNDSPGLTFGYILLTLSVIKPPGEWSSQLNHFLPIFLRCSSFHFISLILTCQYIERLPK